MRCGLTRRDFFIQREDRKLVIATSRVFWSFRKLLRRGAPAFRSNHAESGAASQFQP